MTFDPILILLYVLLGSAALALIRVVLGPTLADRMVALSVVSSIVLAALVLQAVRENLTLYLDVALVYDIFGFIGILAVTRYFIGKRGER